MAITLDATVGGANANTYIGLLMQTLLLRA